MAQEFTPIQEPRRTNNTTIIIVVVIVVLLCCCCAILAGGWFFGDVIIEALNDLTLVLPTLALPV